MKIGGLRTRTSYFESLACLRSLVIGMLIVTVLASHSAVAADIKGQVMGRGAPITQSTVILMQASAGEPQQIAQTKTDSHGNFAMHGTGVPGSSLYLIASGGIPSANKAGGNNPAILLLSVVGNKSPVPVVIDEMTTIASVFTHAQFIVGASIKGLPLALGIAAGNVPNLVDLETGGLGPVIQDPLNSSQTGTLATFNTLANLLAGCITRVHDDACNKLFAVATPPGGVAPSDTLTAAQNIARNPAHQAQALFALLDDFYPVAAGGRWRPVPFIPYLSFAPSAWTLTLVYAGGGLNSPGGMAIDGEGNLWTADNFLVGAQSTIYHDFGGGVSKLAPDGKPLSAMTLGYRGGGIDGPGFGIAISADDKVWATSLGGETISVFDRNTGKPLSPETGYNFGGQLGQMQGIITTPNGDVWALDNQKDQIVYLPKGDATQGRILGRTVDGSTRGRHAPGQGPLPSRRRPAGPDLDHQWRRRHGDAIPGERSRQSGANQSRVRSAGHCHR